MASRFEKFSNRGRRALGFAHEEAARLNHDCISTEHILLGLLRVPDGVGAQILDALGVNTSNLRAAVEITVRSGWKLQGASDVGGLTPRAKKAIELAVDEARQWDHSYIGTEHLLAGLSREGESTAAAALESQRVTLVQIRAEMGRILGQPPPQVEIERLRPSIGVPTPREVRPGNGNSPTDKSATRYWVGTHEPTATLPWPALLLAGIVGGIVGGIAALAAAALVGLL